MYADFFKWMKWVVLYLIFLAFPAFLIILSKVHGDLVPGLLIGIAMYFLFFNKKTARCESDREEGMSDGKNGNSAAGQL
jgi:hypothetical protein